MVKDLPAVSNVWIFLPTKQANERETSNGWNTDFHSLETLCRLTADLLKFILLMR